MFFKMRSAYFVAAMSTVLTVAAVASAKYGAHKSHIAFTATGPLGMGIEGTVEKLAVEEDDKTITFKTSIADVKTGIPQRDSHLKTIIKEHPVKLVLSKDQLDSKPKKGGTVTGSLTLNNKKKDVPVKYDIDGAKHVTATFDFDLTKHGVDKDALCKLGVCAKPNGTVKVTFDLTE
jgi:hypothetical protein